MKQKRNLPLPVYPFFIAMASVLSLAAFNIEEMELLSSLRTLLIGLLLTMILFLLGRCIFRTWHKSAFFTAIVVVLFTSYGQVFDLLQKPVFGIFIGRHRYLAGVYLILLILGAWLIARMKRVKVWTRILNLAGIVLVLLPAFQITSYAIRKADYDRKQAETASPLSQASQLVPGENPDIYFIILDTYTRADTLQEEFGFDNSGFLDALRKLGFYVADCSRSNYAHTRLALSSAMNLNYLDDLGVDLSKDTRDIASLNPYIVHSFVRDQLSQIGYKTAAFRTGYRFTDFADADIYFRPAKNFLFFPFIEPFEYLFIKNTAFRFVMDTHPDLVEKYFKELNFPFSDQYWRVVSTLDDLPGVAQIDDPKFVFVHLDVPHHPFIFLPDGSINPERKYYPGVYMPDDMEIRKQGYINQVKYINNAILPVVESILENSKKPPVIILQGDHGLQGGGRVRILNAIYLPGGAGDSLYPSISPVNTFRVVFNRYFGTHYELLDDRTYYSDYEDKMELKLVPETSTSCITP